MSHQLQFAVGQAAAIHLQFQVRDHRTEVGVAAAFAVAVEHALHVRRAGLDRRERIATASSLSLWQWMPSLAFGNLARTSATVSAICSGRLPPFVSQRMMVGAGAERGVQRVERVFRVGAEPVEEMLGVVERAAPAVFQMADGVGDHSQVLFERGLERDVDMKIPRFAEDRHDRRLGGEQPLHDGVVGRGGVRASSAAERGEHSGVQLQRLRPLEKLHVFRLAPGHPPSIKVTPISPRESAILILSSTE